MHWSDSLASLRFVRLVFLLAASTLSVFGGRNTTSVLPHFSLKRSRNPPVWTSWLLFAFFVGDAKVVPEAPKVVQRAFCLAYAPLRSRRLNACDACRLVVRCVSCPVDRLCPARCGCLACCLKRRPTAGESRPALAAERAPHQLRHARFGLLICLQFFDNIILLAA